MPVQQELLPIFQGGQRIGETLTESGKVPVLLSLTVAPANPLLYEQASERLGGSVLQLPHRFPPNPPCYIS